MGRTCFQSGAPGCCLIYPPIHFSAEASRMLAVIVCVVILQVILLQMTVSFLHIQSSLMIRLLLSYAFAVCSSNFLGIRLSELVQKLFYLKVSFFNMLMWM